MSVDLYSLDVFITNLEKVRNYRNFKRVVDICKELSINRQNWENWIHKGTLPSVELLLKIANYMEMDLNYFFIKDAEPQNYDLNISFNREPGKVELYNAIMPFTPTTVTQKVLAVLNDCIKKKGIYALVNKQTNGLSRIFNEFRKRYAFKILYSESDNLEFDLTIDLKEIDMIIFDNANRISTAGLNKIFEYKKGFSGTLIFGGQKMDNILTNPDFFIKLSALYPIDNITFDDLERIIRKALPAVNLEILREIKSLTKCDLNKLYEFLKEYYIQKQANKNFTLNFEDVIIISDKIK